MKEWWLLRRYRVPQECLLPMRLRMRTARTLRRRRAISVRYSYLNNILAQNPSYRLNLRLPGPTSPSLLATFPHRHDHVAYPDSFPSLLVCAGSRSPCSHHSVLRRLSAQRLVSSIPNGQASVAVKSSYRRGSRHPCFWFSNAAGCI